MLRTPLATISGNRPRNKELSPFQRGILVGQAAQGLSYGKIAKATKLHRNTVRQAVINTSLQQNGESRPRSGRPPLATDRGRRHIIRIARVNPRLTYEKLKEEAGHNFSQSTVYRILKEYGLTNWLAKQRPLLTEEVAAKRLAWCRQRRHWGWEEWSKVIWSDECSVERGTSKERAWVFRLPQEKWIKEMIQPKKKGKDVSVMVWGAFYGVGEQSNLLRLARDPNSGRQGYSAASYVGVLDEALPTLWEPGLLFMQDNASIHTSRLARQWFQENGIEVLEWPPYSPDLNPIEHLWYRLKKNVYDIRPDIEEVGGNVDHIQEVLYDSLEQAWVRIEGKVMEDLVRSMQRRVKAVIAADGWYTKY